MNQTQTQISSQKKKKKDLPKHKFARKKPKYANKPRFARNPDHERTFKLEIK